MGRHLSSSSGKIAELPLQDGEIRRAGETRAFSVDGRIACASHRDRAAAGHGECRAPRDFDDDATDLRPLADIEREVARIVLLAGA